MKVIVAEKPSVARGIAEVVGAHSREDGYIEGAGYIVTWARGHLVELWPDLKDYDAAYEKWDINMLPIIPDPFRYRVGTGDGVRQQFNIIKKLINDPDCTEVVCATDAGREGELIFRLIYNEAHCTKPVTRLWVSSLEESSIREGMANLRPDSDYDDLYDAACARQQQDFLLGTNMSRFYTCKYHTKVIVGRVMTAVHNFVVKRDLEIENFVPVPYYIISTDLGGFIASHREDDKDSASECMDMCQGKSATVTSVETKDVVTKPDPLYDLTTLQRDCNKTFGYSAQETLSIAQSLYEARLATYPRTSSKYITAAQEGTVLSLIEHLKTSGMAHGLPEFEPSLRRIVDDSKVTDHHGILPTNEVTTSSFASLTDEQKNVLTLVIWRLLAAVAPDSVHKSTKALFDISGYEFKAEGKEIVDSGFKAVILAKYRALGKTAVETENILPPLSEGQSLMTDNWLNEEKQTTPPPHYTDNTLLGAMETCGKDIEDEALKEALKGKGVGTPATRAEVIEKLIRYKYIERQGTKLISTQLGRDVIEVIDPEFAQPDLTAKWESQLTDIAEGRLPAMLFASDVTDFLHEFINTHRDEAPVKAIAQSSGDREVLGRCPKCGSPVCENKAGYGCTAGRDACDFIIWKSMGNREHPKTITPAQVKKILDKGRSDLIKGFVGSSGKTFDAYLVLNEDKNGVKFDFGESDSGEKAPVGKCPLCGKEVFGGPRGWSCSDSACRFIIWKTVGSKEHPKTLTEAQVKKLLSVKKTDLIKGFVGKSGKSFDAYLVLQSDGKVGFEFPPRK